MIQIKAVFLDIDGVLNCRGSKSRCGAFIGIDNSKVKLLRKIVEATNAVIILSSSWRDGWCKTQYDDDIHDELGVYMNKKLAKEKLHILDKTKTLNDRGEEIHTYLKEHKAID